MSNGAGRGGTRAMMIAVSVLALVAIGALGWWYSRPSVTVSEVIDGPVVQAFYATGTVRPRIEYPISSSVGGIVDQVLVSQGQAVKKGQPLAVVSDPNLAYQADKAKADLKMRREFADPVASPVLKQFDQQITAAEAMLKVADQTSQRFSNLAEKNAASANDRDQSVEHTKKIWGDLESLKAQRAAKLRELAEDVEVAESADRAAQESLQRQTLRSPVDGVVLDQPIGQGVRLEINGHLMQIADAVAQNLIMRAAVDEENIGGVTPGQTVKMALYSFPNRVFEGIVEQRYPQADSTRRTFDVDIKFASIEPKLQPGMTGELAFIEATRDSALIVPSQAVQRNAIWIIRGGKLVQADAKIGLRSIERTEVASGLKAGDQIVISPLGDLKANDSVRVGTKVDPKVAADLNKPSETTLFRGFN
jgi:HlyD family secretion protein